MNVAKDAPGMRGIRSRNLGDGRLRQKRSDTEVGTVEKEYGVDFGVRSDMKLRTLLKTRGVESLSQLLEQEREQQSGE
jgi:hypothetical protein